MRNYALINTITKEVENVIVWDEVSPYLPPEGMELVLLDHPNAGIGWMYQDNLFINPAMPVMPIEPTTITV